MIPTHRIFENEGFEPNTVEDWITDCKAPLAERPYPEYPA
jgi:hypothetical protein